MPTPNPNERSRKRAVKTVMNRVKLSLVALLPAFWLLASGQSLLDPCDICASRGFDVSKSTFEGGKQCPLHSVCSFDTAARPVKSRIGPQVPKGKFMPLEPIARSHAVERTPTLVSAQRESPIALATCWQFACRAALDPRAPSSIS